MTFLDENSSKINFDGGRKEGNEREEEEEDWVGDSGMRGKGRRIKEGGDEGEEEGKR